MPLVSLRSDLWARAGFPNVLELVEYAQVAVIDMISNSQQRKELSAFVGSLLNIPDEVIPGGHVPIL